MTRTNHDQPEGRAGGPLAVCINDCQLDYGQAGSELVRVCFQVRCAFAEMRWGRSAAEAFSAAAISIDDPQAGSPQYKNSSL